MQQPSAISDYLDVLTRELNFDIPLARRVRQEVEDHLWEAAAAEPRDASIEAQHRAVRNFGDPRAIASAYAALSLLRQTRRGGAILIFGTAGVFVAMWGRLAWHGPMQWSVGLQEVSRIGGFIDRYAFRLAFAIGIIGWAYISTRPVAKRFHAAYGGELRRGLLLCAAAALSLFASVIADVALTGLHIFNSGLRAAGLVPLLSLAAEMAISGVLVYQIRRTFQRAALASLLLRSS